MRATKWIIPLIVIGLVLSSVGLVSGSEGGTISGTVTDASTTDPISGALIEVTGTDFSATTTTTTDGFYIIEDVPEGSYNVTASADGYESETETGVEVTSEAPAATVDFVLQPLDTDGEPEEGKRKGFVGQVQGEPAGSVTLVLQGTGEPVTIFLPADYVVKRPGGPHAGNFEDGARVAVLAEMDADGDWVVIQVLVKPVKPTPPINGAVMEVNVEDGTITIVTPSGVAHTLQLPPGAAPPLVGELVTVFPGRAPEAGEDGKGPPTEVRGLVRASQVRERLQRHLQEVTAQDGEPSDEEAEQHAQLVSNLAALLENHASQHVDILQSLSEKDLPEPALNGILTALENAERGREEARRNAEEARAKAGSPADHQGPPGAEESGPPDEKGPPGDQPGQSGEGDESEGEAGPPGGTMPTPEPTPGPGAGQGQQGEGQGRGGGR